MHYLHFPFALPSITRQRKKRAFWDRYFACCFGCCETWTCGDLTDLLVLVQYILGDTICSRFSALWNLLRSSDLSNVDLKSDNHLNSVWQRLFYGRCQWFSGGCGCFGLIFFLIVEANSCLCLLSCPGHSHLTCIIINFCDKQIKTSCCLYFYKVQDQKKSFF